MNNTIKAMIDLLDNSGAGIVSVTLGKYTIMITDDKDGADILMDAWDDYVEDERNRYE